MLSLFEVAVLIFEVLERKSLMLCKLCYEFLSSCGNMRIRKIRIKSFSPFLLLFLSWRWDSSFCSLRHCISHLWAHCSLSVCLWLKHSKRDCERAVCSSTQCFASVWFVFHKKICILHQGKSFAFPWNRHLIPFWYCSNN